AATPFTTSTNAAARATPSAWIDAARLARSLFTAHAPFMGKGRVVGRTKLLDVGGRNKSGPFRRRRHARSLRLEPAGRGAGGSEGHERRLLDFAARERVRAAGVKAAPARRLRRVGHLAGERVGQEAAAVRVRDRVDQRLAVRMDWLLPEHGRRAGL